MKNSTPKLAIENYKTQIEKMLHQGGEKIVFLDNNALRPLLLLKDLPQDSFVFDDKSPTRDVFAYISKSIINNIYDPVMNRKLISSSRGYLNFIFNMIIPEYEVHISRSIFDEISYQTEATHDMMKRISRHDPMYANFDARKEILDNLMGHMKNYFESSGIETDPNIGQRAATYKKNFGLDGVTIADIELFLNARDHATKIEKPFEIWTHDRDFNSLVEAHLHEKKRNSEVPAFHIRRPYVDFNSYSRQRVDN